MDVNDLITMKQLLESDIRRLIVDFEHKTGMVPLIEVEYHTINYVGKPTERIPQVTATIQL